jgi:hypothetical protein
MISQTFAKYYSSDKLLQVERLQVNWDYSSPYIQLWGQIYFAIRIRSANYQQGFQTAARYTKLGDGMKKATTLST